MWVGSIFPKASQFWIAVGRIWWNCKDHKKCQYSCKVCNFNLFDDCVIMNSCEFWQTYNNFARKLCCSLKGCIWTYWSTRNVGWKGQNPSSCSPCRHVFFEHFTYDETSNIYCWKFLLMWLLSFMYIFLGILARLTEADETDMKAQNFQLIRYWYLLMSLKQSLKSLQQSFTAFNLQVALWVY